MLRAAAACLAGSALITGFGAALGGAGLTGLALAPWAVLALAALADLALSLRRGATVALDLPAEAFCGEAVPLVLRVTPPPAGAVARLDWPEGLEGPAEIALQGQRTETQCRALRRGVWSLRRIWLQWPSRLGLFDMVPRLDLTHSLRVVPNVRPALSGQITTTVLSTLYGVKDNRALGEGAEFHQLRDFARGMDVKTIDWKRSARSRTLLARELRAERNHHVILALDTGYLMGQRVGGLAKLDLAITAALATAWAAAVGGDLVGYFAYDLRPHGFVAPQPGRLAFARLRSWAADLAVSGHATNHTLALTALNARTPKRSLVILFTDFIDTTSAELMLETIRLLTQRHLVLFVTLRDAELERLVDQPAQDLDEVATLVAAGGWVQDRRRVLERLVRMGVTLVDATPETLTARLVSTYLDIKSRDLM